MKLHGRLLLIIGASITSFCTIVRKTFLLIEDTAVAVFTGIPQMSLNYVFMRTDFNTSTWLHSIAER